MHAHFYGGGLPDLLRRRRTRPCLVPSPDGEVMQAMNAGFPFGRAYHDPAVGLAQMRAVGLTHRLLTFPGALGLDVLPADEVATTIATFNDALAEMGHASEGALIGLGGLPLADPPRAAVELARLRTDLRLPGVILPGNDFASVAAMERLATVLDAASAAGCLVMVHPGLSVGQEPPAPAPDFPQYRTSVVELQAQITQTALTLVLGNAMGRWPGIRWQVVNLGGTLPFVMERAEAVARHRNPDDPFPRERLRAIWTDCASLGPRALHAAVRLFGADRVMLGSDWPIFREDPVATALNPAALDPPACMAVAGRTALALLEGVGGWPGHAG